MLLHYDSLARGHGRAARLTSGCRRLFGSLLLGLSCLLAPAASAQAPPASFTANFTNGGDTVTVDFALHPIRSSNFSVIVQNSSGTFDTHTAAAPATYLGTPVGYPGALACATLKANGTLLARIMFEDATTWTTNSGTVTGGAASPSGDPNWTKQWPGFTMASGGAGSNEYAAELGIDSSYDHFNRSALNAADNLSIIEHSVLCANVLYLRDAGILHRIGRVVMRGDQLQDPYRNKTGGALLDETANQWNNVLPASTHDLTAMLSASSVGGGLAWVGVIGTSSRYSINDSDANGDFSVIGRHEIGHNWGSNHFEGNTPEGVTIMSGNALSRISSTELRKIVDHRNTKLGILDNLGPYSFPLPPRASLDFGPATYGANTSFNVMANDHDGNGQSLSILSFDSSSNLGGQLTQSAGNLVLQSVAHHGQMDWFNYRIQDSAGRTATGIVYVQGENASTKLTGTGIGTTGTWGGGNTFDKALDGNLSTAYDADSATGDWVGLDLGAANTKVVTKVKYAARASQEGRMDGGMIQGSNVADFSSGVVTLYTISGAPPSGVLTSTSINNSAAYRYVRYLGPTDGWCNIAEIEFWGADPAAPNPPNGVTASGAGAGLIDVSWNAASFATSYNVKRATSSGGPYTTIAPNVTATSFSDSGLVGGATYYYVVSAVNGVGESANSAQVSAVASPTPSSDWKFDDGSGAVATDSSPNANDGSVNGATWTTGFVGTALQFNGTNSFVTFGTGPSVSGLNDFTVAAWIKTSAATNGVIIQQRDAAGFNGQYRFRVNSNGTLNFMVYGDSAYQFDFATTQAVNDGNWHHVVAVRDGNAGSIYIDGNPTPAATASGTARNLAASISTAVGRDVRDNNTNFSGSIDEVLVYRAIALSGSDVESLYDSYFAPLPPATPIGLSATPGNNQVALSWNASSGATSYNVKRSTTSGSGYSTIGSPAGNGFTDTTAANGTTYYYVVSALNAGGESGNSTQVSATPQGVAPTYVAAGAIASGTGTIAPALPSGIATGDILLLFVETANEASSVSNANGGTWAQVTGSPQGTGTAGGSAATRLTAFWSRYNGTQGAPTLADSGNHQIARMIAIRGAAASGNPWNVTAGAVEATSDTSASVPGATTTVANTLVVIAIAGSLPDSNGTTNFSGWSNANLSSLTERTDDARNVGNGGALGIATGVKATAGAYGNTVSTHASSAAKGLISIAIKN